MMNDISLIHFAGAVWTVPELVFEKNQLILALQHLPSGVSSDSEVSLLHLDAFMSRIIFNDLTLLTLVQYAADEYDGDRRES